MTLGRRERLLLRASYLFLIRCWFEKAFRSRDPRTEPGMEYHNEKIFNIAADSHAIHYGSCTEREQQYINERTSHDRGHYKNQRNTGLG